MAKDVWEIKHVPERTKRSIKAYAAARGLTIAEALTHRFDPPVLSKKHGKDEKEKKEEREEKEKRGGHEAPAGKGGGRPGAE